MIKDIEKEGVKLLKKDGLMDYLTPTPGCYVITLNDEVVYVGKSRRVLYRCAQHYYYCLNEQSHDGKGTNYKYKLLGQAVRSGQYQIGFYQVNDNPEAEEEVIEAFGSPLMNIKVRDKIRNDIYKIQTVNELMETTKYVINDYNRKNIKKHLENIKVNKYEQSRLNYYLRTELKEDEKLKEWETIERYKEIKQLLEELEKLLKEEVL